MKGSSPEDAAGAALQTVVAPHSTRSTAQTHRWFPPTRPRPMSFQGGEPVISSAQPSSNIASVRQSGPHADWRAFLCALASMPDGSGASAICCDSAMGPSKLYDQLRKVLLGFVRSACCSRPEVPRKALGPAVRGHAHLLVLYPPRFIRAREHQVHCQPFRDRWR